MTKLLKIILIWMELRLGEGYCPEWRASGSKGHSIRDGALAMAAVRIPMKHVRFLIENGADSSVKNWLPFRMAAANGDLTMLSWLLQQSEPSAYALKDAINWAKGKGQAEAVGLLHNLIGSADKNNLQ